MRRWGIAAAALIVAAAAAGVAWLAWPANDAGGLAPAPANVPAAAHPSDPAPLHAAAGEAGTERAQDAAILPEGRRNAPSTPEPPREPGVRYLRVVDEDGRPAPDARILVMREGIIDAYDWEDFSRGGDPVDAWGRYTLEVEIDGDQADRWIAMGSGGRCSTIVRTPEGNGDFTLTLHEGNRIAGSVRDAGGGNPLAGVTVVLAMGKTGASTWPPQAISGADGSYRFEGLPPGTPFIPIIRDAERYSGPDVYDDYELWGWDAAEEEDGAAETLDSMLARGRAKQFDGTGETATIDLRAGVTPGQDVTLVVQLPEEIPADAAVACRWTRPAGHEPRQELRRLHPAQGRSRWELFLSEGSHTFEFVANGARGRLELAATGTRDARPVEHVRLAPTRPLVVQFVDDAGAPRRRAGIALSFGVAFERDPAIIDGRRGVETQSAAASSENGRLRYPEPPAFWPEPQGIPRTLYLAAEGESCFAVPQRILGLAHVPFPIASFAEALAQPGSEPVVLRVPARRWVPLPIRLVDRQGQPLGGLTLENNRPKAFGGTATWTTDGAGRAILRLHDLEALEGDDPGAFEQALLRVTTPEVFGQVPVQAVADWLRPAPHVVRGGRFLEPGTYTLVTHPARAVEVRLIDTEGSPVAELEGLIVFLHHGERCTQSFHTDVAGRAALQFPVLDEPLPLRFTLESGAQDTATLQPGARSVTFRNLPRSR